MKREGGKRKGNEQRGKRSKKVKVISQQHGKMWNE